MHRKWNKLFIGILSIVLTFSCEKNDDIKSYHSLRIKKISTEALGTSEGSMTFQYDENNLLIRGNHSGGIYFLNEYDDLNQLIRKTSYNSIGPYHYFTFQYDSNTITRMRYQYYSYQDSWGGDNEKSVYCYNSQNNCERIDYYRKDENAQWIKQEEYSICTWSNYNLTEYQHYVGDSLDYSETFKYDNKLNPGRLINYIISPETKSRNNIVNSSIQYSDGRSSKAKYHYTYNKYGYLWVKVRIDDFGTIMKEYEYEFY